MNTYRAVSRYGRAVYGDEVVELELSAVEERDLVASGHLEVVPRTYVQLSRNYSAAEQGETFEAALPVELEAALLEGGHIERVDEPVAAEQGETFEAALPVELEAALLEGGHIERVDEPVTTTTTTVAKKAATTRRKKGS